MEANRKRQRKSIAVGVCLLCLAAAGFLGVKAYRYYNYRMCPFSEDEVSSISMYDSRQIEKKEITRREDIAELVDAMNQKGERYLTSAGVRPSGYGIYLSFQMKDGSQIHYFCQSYPTVAYITDGSVQIKQEGGFDFWDYWDRVDYEVRKDAGAELARAMTAFRAELQREE